MDHRDDDWRRRVKDSLRPLRDRLVHGLGGTLPERGITYDQLVHLLYPTLPDSLRGEVDEAAAGDLTQASTIRRMLGTIEHQVAPTAFSVQLAQGDAVRCTVGDVELLADAADAAVTPGLRSGEYESHLTAVFERYCTPGMTVVDVGANFGYYSLLASKLVGESGRVIALEPNSENCRLLLSSLRLHGTGNVQLLPVAADTATGWAYYSTHVGSNGGLIDDRDLLAHPGVVVPTFRLDDIVDGPVGFLKMDVEGAEGRVVKGATRLIDARPAGHHDRAQGGDAPAGFEDLGGGVPRLLRGSRICTVGPGARQRRGEALPVGRGSAGRVGGQRASCRDILLMPAGT